MRKEDKAFCFFFQAEDGIRDYKVTGVQTCALPIWSAGTTRRRRLRADLDSGPGGPQRFRSVGRQDPLEAVMAWLSREPGIAPLHRLPRLQDANLQNAGAHPVFQPPPYDRAVVARDDDIEGDRPAEKMRLARPVGRIV